MQQSREFKHFAPKLAPIFLYFFSSIARFFVFNKLSFFCFSRVFFPLFFTMWFILKLPKQRRVAAWAVDDLDDLLRGVRILRRRGRERGHGHRRAGGWPPTLGGIPRELDPKVNSGALLLARRAP